MNLLSIESLNKSYIDKVLFKDISFGMDENDKIGLIGVNGTGKSTFLKVIAGALVPDEGKIIMGNKVRIAYLPQNPTLNDEATVLQQVLHGNPSKSEKEFEAKTVLNKLGINDFDAIMGTLSGGQRKRVALASAIIDPAELLILDEPTNHIDNDTVIWLEQYINKRKGALIMVTHDRYFLDRIVNRIIELDKGSIYSYPGNYFRFLELKIEREERLQSMENKRQNLLHNELAWIKRGAKARSTKQKARIERFEKLQQNNQTAGGDKVQISTIASRLGKKVIELNHINKRYYDNKLINDFSYTFLKDDRIGIVGPNGVGKSTLLCIIAGKLNPDKGTIDYGQTVKLGFFTQENAEIDDNLKVIEYIKEVAEYLPTSDGGTISASQMLERFLFTPSLQWTTVAKLSGGERRRLFLLKVLMGAPNVLMLDEPTNDLDIETLTILEDYLEDFRGAVIAVSHDRYFLDRMANKIFSFEGAGRITCHLGNYTEFREKQNPQTTEDNFIERINKKETSFKEKPKERLIKFSYQEQKDFEIIDGIIAGLEKEISEVHEKINQAGSDFSLLQNLVDIQQNLETQLEEKMDRWVYLNDLAEEINTNKNR